MMAFAGVAQSPRAGNGVVETETVVMRSISGTVHWIRAQHRPLEKL